MITTTLARYFAKRFVVASLSVFFGIVILIVLVDYIELTRRSSGLANASALLVAQTSIYRVPQLLERLMPFCVLVGAMTSYLALSRSLELVVARAAGISAWQFMTPALLSALILGVLATVVYNPASAAMQERAKELEAEIFSAPGRSASQESGAFWINQVTSEGQAIISSTSSQGQGARLIGVSVFRFEPGGGFRERIEAREATLEPGRWILKGARVFALSNPPVEKETITLPTNLNEAQVRNSFATPETVSFWQLPAYIRSTENSGLAAAGYRLQYDKLIARPFLLASMVMLAGAVSLRFFRFGGVQRMVLGGIAAGFLLYVLSKITEDLSKAALIHPLAAAWLPVCVGGLTGFLALLYQEDG
ncbi:MAG: LPS export ABC transporter permease LptG [Bradyrhizobiaceae bacterium]|nr:MAG: LPS export ABC transporter permease LptG [Bradyrhizobiaceae bacterium]